MSKLSLVPPNYCSCTVNRARNLPNKGKDGGIDAFCTISMGKDKFVTAVVDKTTAPDWHEQCDMAIVDDATVKLTVYHKGHNSLSKGDFIGRAYVSLRDLPDYDRVQTKWYKLTNKDGKIDKDRGEIEVSLQFYSKNTTTGSVLDLTTKKKHFSLKEMKHSLSAKLKSAAKHKHDGDTQLADQRRRLGGDNGSSYNVHDDSPSESTSYTGSHLSLNSMSYNNNNDQPRKKSLAPSIGTPYSRRSITSDYETSSILDSASMYGGDDASIPSSSVRSQAPQPKEVPINEPLTPKKKSKAPIPTIITPDSPVLTDRSRSLTITADESPTKAETFFGLSTIKENYDTDENLPSSKNPLDDEANIDHYFDQMNQSNEPKKSKKSAPILQPPKEQKHSTHSQSDEIYTPATSISIKIEPKSTSSTSTQRRSETRDDSTDEDVDEILGKFEPDNKFSGGFNQTPSSNRSGNSALPDIVGEQAGKKLSPHGKKPSSNGLCVLGYDNVKSVPVQTKVREELEYLDRDDLLHVIAYQTDIIKKRDTRVKDLEQYTDGLLCKIVEQCPTILQSGGIQFNNLRT